MALSANRQLALYLLLSHPLSAMRIALNFLPPASSKTQAALDVANLINTTLSLNLGQNDITDIQNFLAASTAIQTSAGVFKVVENPVLLAKAFDAGYDPGTGCPDAPRGAAIFTLLA